jgi:2Fe-2S ferredoxin
MSADRARVCFQPSGRIVEVAVGTTLLEAARAAGLPVGSSCGGDGVCGRCGLVVLGGELSAETVEESRIKADNRVDPHARLSCRALVVGDAEVTAPYW